MGEQLTGAGRLVTGGVVDPTVRSIVEGWLADNGWDGIVCHGGCACFVGDLMPCSSGVCPGASPCVRVRCGSTPGCEGCDDYDSDWSDEGGAGAPCGWCAVSELRRAELLREIGSAGGRDGVSGGAE